MKRFLWILIMGALLFAACGRKAAVKTVKETGFIKLEKISPAGAFETAEGLLLMDWTEGRLLHLSFDGDILSEYAEEGSGPGEFNNGRAIFLGGTAENFFVAAIDRNAVLQFALKEGKITYVDEFNVDIGTVRGGAVDDRGRIIALVSEAPYEVAVFDAKGELQETYIETDEESREISPENLIASMRWVFMRGDMLIVTEYMTYTMYFYRTKEGKAELVKSRKPEVVLAEDNYQLSTNGNSISLSGVPGFLGGIFDGEELHLVLFNNGEGGMEVYQVYDADGGFNGYIHTEDPELKINGLLCRTSRGIAAITSKGEEARISFLR